MTYCTFSDTSHSTGMVFLFLSAVDAFIGPDINVFDN